jgi:ribosomal protein L40E
MNTNKNAEIKEHKAPEEETVCFECGYSGDVGAKVCVKCGTDLK